MDAVFSTESTRGGDDGDEEGMGTSGEKIEEVARKQAEREQRERERAAELERQREAERRRRERE